MLTLTKSTKKLKAAHSEIGKNFQFKVNLRLLIKKIFLFE